MRLKNSPRHGRFGWFKKRPPVDHCNARWIPAFAGMTGSVLREWREPITAWFLVPTLPRGNAYGPRHGRFGWFKKRTPVRITVMPNGFPPSREWRGAFCGNNGNPWLSGDWYFFVISAKAGIHKGSWIGLLEVFWAVFCFILVWKFAR